MTEARDAAAAYAEQRPHVELRQEPPHDARARRRRTLEWVPIVGTPLVVLGDLQVAYALVPWACRTGARLPFVATVVAAVLLLLGLALLARRTWRSAGGGWPGEELAHGVRTRFLGGLGVLVSLFGLGVVVALAVPYLALHPCQ